MVPTPADFAAGRPGAPAREEEGAVSRLGSAKPGQVMVKRATLVGRKDDGERQRREGPSEGQPPEAMGQGGGGAKETPILLRASALNYAPDCELESPKLLPE